ncbi:retrotransposon protein, putative, ty1-copia subclass [Tanacetum coccineum]
MFLRRFARQSSSLKMMSAKETTAIMGKKVGPEVVLNSREVLIGMYIKTLNLITRVPQDEGYRKSMESLTRQRLAICEAEKDVKNIKKQIVKVDELIDEAKFEYKVLDKLLVLNKDFVDFVRNFNMHCVGKTVSELHALLIDYEKGLKDKAPTPQVLAIQKGRVNKPKPQANKKGKGKGKADKNKQVVAYQPKPKQNPSQKKENPKKDQACHHCNVVGHWKRNCPLYLEELRTNKNKKAEHGAAPSGNLFMIELFNLTRKLNSWVYDTGCGIHICNTLQGFRVKRKLSYGEQYLHVGNGAQAAVEAIGVFNLVLPSGLVLAISVNGVFEIDMNDNVSKYNNNSIFSINKKRKLDLNSSYLWHCRLAHIGKTRMQKLQREGLLESINDGSYDKCESCISGKMTKKPFNNNIERATDLLGLIHTDVCGPFRHVSRKGASYFLTFTDDFSRYGYVYLLKHKHEVFETFKALESVLPVRISSILQYVWGCEAYVKCDSADKLQQRSVKCIFVGYPKETMGYYFYFPPENKVIVARYGYFLERDLISQEFSGRDYDLEDDHMDTLPLYITSEFHRGSWEPANLKLHLDPHKVIGHSAMDEEMISMKVNEVWTKVDPPPNAKIVRSKWLFKKNDDNGCLAAYYDYEIWQMDVKTAFLNGRLDEDIYMEQPEGYVNPRYPNRVCKLQRSIYGLKQASRQWNKRFDEEIKNFRFTQNRDESCVYRKASGSNVVFLILYVDDILIMGNNIPRLKEVKAYLRKCFSMKDLGEAAYILGIKIYRDRSKQLIGLNDTKSQTGYVFVVNGGAVDWKSKKQTMIVMSATQAKYMAASEAAMEAVGLGNLLEILE